MEKTIKARCTQKLYAYDVLLFIHGDVYTFDVTSFESPTPEFALPDKKEYWMQPMETHRRYRVKKGPFSFYFYDKNYSEYHGLLNFSEFFNELDMELTSENVERIFRECLSEEKEGDNVCLVEAVQHNVQFAMKKDKLKFYQEEIRGLLEQLPDDFRESKAGGWSFLNLCVRKDGTQWTGSHSSMEQLVCLGIGAGKMKYLLPRTLWKVMPGGMPYVAIIDK